MTMVLLLTPVFASEDLKVGAQVDKKQVPAGEPFTFSITIAGSIQETPKVHLTAFDGFEILSTGQSQSLQIRSGQVNSTLTLLYTLAPTAPGTHTLGPVKIEYQGKEYQTPPIEVTVLPGRGPPRKRPQRRPEPTPEEESLPLEGGTIL